MRAPVMVVLCCALAASGAALAAEGPRPVVHVAGAPDIVFADRPVQVRLRATLEPENARAPANRIVTATLSPALVPATDPEAMVELAPVEFTLRPSADRAASVRFALDPAPLRDGGTVLLTLRWDGHSAGQTLRVRPARAPGDDLRARGMHLYTQRGDRVVLLIPRWGASAHRRWAVPRTVQRWLTLDPEAPVLVLTTSPGPDDAFDRLAQRLRAQGRAAWVVRPGSREAPGAPVLGLVAAAGRVAPQSQAMVLIAAGSEDILFGTPPRLWGRALHALVSRAQALAPRERREIVLALPAVPPGLHDRAGAYLAQARAVIRERHVRSVDLEAAVAAAGGWDGARERLSPNPAGRARATERLAGAVDVAGRRRAVYVTAGLALVAILLLAARVLRSRAHRRRLVAISCGEDVPA